MDDMTIERQIFDWEEWDNVDEGVLRFYDVQLKVPVGEFMPGDEFDTAVVDLQNSKLVLYLNEDRTEERVFQLNISVGEEVK
jgi:hypothetical protein